MTNPTLTDQRARVAKRLPELIGLLTSSVPTYDPVFFWRGKNRYDRTAITEREWLEVARLAEGTLTEREHAAFRHALWADTTDKARERNYVSASADQRIAALCRVLDKENTEGSEPRARLRNS